MSYRISVQKIVDFSAGFTKDWPYQWREFFCDWSALCFGQGIEPPSWRLGDDVLATGAGGLLFRSNRRVEGLNLVIYTEHLGAADWIEVHDPGKDLPRDQTSWNE